MSSPHLHKAAVALGTATNRPYHAQCSCGTAGDFATKDSAVGYVAAHFEKLGGIADTILAVDAPDDAKVAAAAVAATPAPTPHIGGIGTMPQPHAPGPVPAVAPPPPPPPPETK